MQFWKLHFFSTGLFNNLAEKFQYIFNWVSVQCANKDLNFSCVITIDVNVLNAMLPGVVYVNFRRCVT